MCTGMFSDYRTLAWMQAGRATQEQLPRQESTISVHGRIHGVSENIPVHIISAEPVSIFTMKLLSQKHTEAQLLNLN
jgi:hypothetical protein